MSQRATGEQALVDWKGKKKLPGVVFVASLGTFECALLLLLFRGNQASPPQGPFVTSQWAMHGK